MPDHSRAEQVMAYMAELLDAAGPDRPAGLRVTRDDTIPLAATDGPTLIVYAMPPRIPAVEVDYAYVTEARVREVLQMRVEARVRVPDGQGPDQAVDSLWLYSVRRIVAGGQFEGLLLRQPQRNGWWRDAARHEYVLSARAQDWELEWETDAGDPAAE